MAREKDAYVHWAQRDHSLKVVERDRWAEAFLEVVAVVEVGRGDGRLA
jgi:hypothetical protein